MVLQIFCYRSINYKSADNLDLSILKMKHRQPNRFPEEKTKQVGKVKCIAFIDLSQVNVTHQLVFFFFPRRFPAQA